MSTDCLGDNCLGTGGYSTDTPFWGGVDTASYKILFFLHIVSIIAAFGPIFIYPLFTRLAAGSSGDAQKQLAMVPYNLVKSTFLPALIAAAFWGILLTLDSDSVYDMSKSWASGAFAIVIALVLVAWFLLRPAQKRYADALAQGENGKSVLRSAKATLGAATGMIHIGLAIIIVLMIWKPGQ